MNIRNEIMVCLPKAVADVYEKRKEIFGISYSEQAKVAIMYYETQKGDINVDTRPTCEKQGSGCDLK